MNSLVPPQNLDAEQSVLGSMFIDSTRRALQIGLELLTAADFYRPVHEEIFDALSALAIRDEPPDLITVQEELRKRGKLEDCGGTEYLMALVDSVPTSANIEHYAKIVLDKATRRRLIADATEIIAAANDEMNDDPVGVLSSKAIARSAVRGAQLVTINDMLPDVIKQFKEYESGTPLMGWRFGIPALDRLSRGVLPDEFVLIAGWPSEGKTSLATQLAVNAAKQGARCLFFSEEMSARSLVERIVLMEARIDGDRARDGMLDIDEWGKIWRVGSDWDDSPVPLTINDKPLAYSKMLAAARNWIIRQTEQKYTGLVIVDYLQIVRCDINAPDLRQQISAMAAGFKSLAREYHYPVVVLSQLSRRKDPNQRPELYNLKESGSLEAEADKVIMLHNPPAGLLDLQNRRWAEIHLRKFRNGSTGSVYSWYHQGSTWFEEANAEQAPPEPEPARQRKWKQKDWTNEYD